MPGILFTSTSWGNLGLGLQANEGDVLQRREDLRMSASLKKIIFMKQTHSDQVNFVNSQDSIVDCDAIITTEKSIGLAVLVGDCVPILIKSDIAVAAVHAGRVGMVNGIASKTAQAMREMGAENLEAILGPSICDECYEVSPEMYDAVVAVVPDSATSKESHKINLQAGVASQLTSQGVEVLNLGICTREFPDFYSHRRSVADSGAEGRQVGLIYL